MEAARLSVFAEPSGMGLAPVGALVLAYARAKVEAEPGPQARSEAVLEPWAMAELGPEPEVKAKQLLTAALSYCLWFQVLA